MRFGCCINSEHIKENEQEFLSEAQKWFDYYEFPAVSLADFTVDEFEEFRLFNEKSPIRCEALNVLFKGDMKVVGEAVDYDRIRQHILCVLERANKLGTEIIVFGSGGAKQIPEGFPYEHAYQQLLTLFEMMIPILPKYNITVVVEALNTMECNFITSIAEAHKLVRDVNSSSVKLLADYYHMMKNGEDVRELAGLGDVLMHTHFADPNGRTYPVEENLSEYAAFFDVLENNGYRGRMSIEAAANPLMVVAQKSMPLFNKYRGR